MASWSSREPTSEIVGDPAFSSFERRTGMKLLLHSGSGSIISARISAARHAKDRLAAEVLAGLLKRRREDRSKHILVEPYLQIDRWPLAGAGRL
ncbi:hypothetical protein MesoLjLb_68980 [Mesorhizobium sp. L-8-3]|nr:hypothetical protein MesoLjLb_68980 [Mesorhizobium sp. L-8-3]